MILVKFNLQRYDFKNGPSFYYIDIGCNAWYASAKKDIANGKGQVIISSPSVNYLVKTQRPLYQSHM